MITPHRLLRKLEPGEFCQGIQRDVVVRIEELRAVFESERERRNQQQQQPPQDGQPPPQGRPKIVAPIAELLALRRMQEHMTRQLERLEREGLPDDPDALTPLQMARLERLAHQQGTIRTMWRDFAKTVGFGEEIFDEPDENDGMTPEDETGIPEDEGMTPEDETGIPEDETGIPEDEEETR